MTPARRPREVGRRSDRTAASRQKDATGSSATLSLRNETDTAAAAQPEYRGLRRAGVVPGLRSTLLLANYGSRPALRSRTKASVVCVPDRSVSRRLPGRHSGRGQAGESAVNAIAALEWDVWPGRVAGSRAAASGRPSRRFQEAPVPACGTRARKAAVSKTTSPEVTLPSLTRLRSLMSTEPAAAGVFSLTS